MHFDIFIYLNKHWIHNYTMNQFLRKNIPNLVTILNLVCGVLAIIMATEPRLIFWSPMLIFAGAFFDLLDGFIARALKSYSELGKQLDSLADMTTFGIAPAILSFSLIKRLIVRGDLMIAVEGFNWYHILLMLSVVFVAIFAALRLAKFNIDESQKYSFKGLPSPANALFIASLVYCGLNNNENLLRTVSKNENLFVLLILTSSLLMILPIRMMSFKFKNVELNENYKKYLLIVIAIFFIIVWREASFALIIPAYVLLSLLPEKINKT